VTEKPHLRQGTARPLRADARRNYDRLLAVAVATVAEKGAEASMEEIARRAGLGSTTLHRHFPTRHALLEAVFHERIEQLCAHARVLLGEPSPVVALSTRLHAFVVHAATQRGLARALSPYDPGGPTPEADCRTVIRAAAGDLLARAQQAGQVDADVTVADLLTLATAIPLATEQTAHGADQARRLVAIVLNGIILERGPAAPLRAPSGTAESKAMSSITPCSGDSSAGF
jgi:AcrR family transcriptional regulator